MTDKSKFNDILSSEITHFLEVFKENEWCFRFSEATVRAEIIDPILKILDWKLPYVKREIQGKDYILCSDKCFLDSQKKIVLETKKYYEDLLTNTHKHKGKSESNEEQIKKYCNDESCVGILTNGIIWLVYVGDDLVRVVDIRKNNDDVWNFFYNISRESFTKNTFSIIPSVQYSEPELHHHITIEKKNYGNKRGELMDAQAFVIQKALSKKSDIVKEPSPFYRKITIPTKGPSKGRSKTPKTVGGVKYNITGDYGVCDKYASLLEINAALDLGFEISLE